MTRRSSRRRLARVAGRAPHRCTPAALVAWVARWSAGIARRVEHHRRTARLAALVLAAVIGASLGGPVAGLIAGTYTVFAVCAWQLRRQRRGNERAGALAVEAVGSLAGELRAGGGLLLEGHDEVIAVLSGSGGSAPPVVEAAARVAAARRISEQLGAPLADLLDRMEDDLRLRHRLRASVAAKTAGCRATVVLLAALPLAGLALGAGMGARPTHQLLHTPLGGACASIALGLQALGLIWTSRMIRSATEAV